MRASLTAAWVILLLLSVTMGTAREEEGSEVEAEAIVVFKSSVGNAAIGLATVAPHSVPRVLVVS
jgi:hypothetical protein